MPQRNTVATMTRTPRTRTAVVALVAILALVAAACETTADDQNHMTARANEARRSVGAAALAVDNHLYSRADAWARQMRDEWVRGGCRNTSGILRHTSSLTGHYEPQHVTRSWRVLGENVGVAPVSGDNNRGETMDRLHRAYVASPKHYQNIVEKRYTRTGQGLVYGPTVDQLRAGHCPGVRANSMMWSTQVYLG